MTESISIPAADNQKISAIYRSANSDGTKNGTSDDAAIKALVIMIHGFPGHKADKNDIFGDIEFSLEKASFDTLRFDFCGCGDSTGQQEDFCFDSAAKDFRSIVNWAKEKGYNRLFYLAEGLGAPLALINMHEMVRGLVFLWPALDPCYTSLQSAIDAATIDEEKNYIKWDNERIGSTLIEDLKNYDPKKYLKRVEKPLLVQHGYEDEDVPIVQLELLRRYTPDAKRIELTTYDGGEHGLRGLKERQTAIYHITQFLSRFE